MPKLELRTEGDRHVIVTRRFAAPPRDASDWLARYREAWEESHGRLDALLARLQADPFAASPDDATTD